MELGEGKVAVVTGGGSGIGLAMAHAFAGAGCSVVLADVQEDALAAAEEAVGAHGTGVLAVPTDVSDPGAVQALADATIDRFGSVHVVCNNAGVAGLGDPWTGPIETWEWVLGVNLWGVVHGIRTFLPHLVAAGEGHIVNTASIAGLWPGLAAAYDATKHAVVAITEDLYNGLREGGIPVGVSCLCPGWIRTGIIDSDRNWPARFGAPPPTDVAGEIVRKHVSRAVDEGMQPGAVADMVLDAVRTGRYWIFPNPDFFELAVERWHRIAEHADPLPPEQVPGMPPRNQLITEVFEAMLAGLDETGGA